MKSRIMIYINKLESYKTAIKNLHWSSKHMNEHKLLDDIADKISEYQDEIAEIAQGVYGKIKLNELKPRKYTITNSKKMLSDLLEDTKKFYPSTSRSKDLIGLRSVVETFLADVNKFQYLMDMCLKEDIKKNLNNKLNENKNMTKKQVVRLTEGDLHRIIKESVNTILKEAFSDLYQWKHFDNDRVFDEHEYYDSFVVLDGTQAIVANCKTYDEAVETAKELAMKYNNSTFEVYGCDENHTYSTDDEDSTLVYSTFDE